MKAANWVATLDEIADIQSGFAFPSKGYSETGHFLVRIGNVQDGEINLDNPRFVELEKRTEKFELRPGDFLTSLTGNIGRVARVNETHLPAALNQRVARLRITSKHALPDYVGFFLQSGSFGERLRQKSHGAAQANVSPKEIASIPVPLPPLSEQERIVAALDQAFAALDRARAHAEANLADADELLDASKSEVIEHWRLKGQIVSLADVTSIDSTLVDPRQPEFFDMRHIGAGNMVSGTDALVDVMTARQEGLKSGKYLFDDTMVLYSKIRPYLRKVARPDFTGVCSADVYPLSPSPELDRDFLFHVLHTKDFTEYAISGSDRAGMPKVNREHLFKYEFWLPPLATQLEAASKIDLLMEATDRLKASLTLKLSEIANLRQSLLQKAFSGELT